MLSSDDEQNQWKVFKDVRKITLKDNKYLLKIIKVNSNNPKVAKHRHSLYMNDKIVHIRNLNFNVLSKF